MIMPDDVIIASAVLIANYTAAAGDGAYNFLERSRFCALQSAGGAMSAHVVHS